MRESRGRRRKSGPEHRPPQLVDGRDLGEEAVAADVEAEALVLGRAGDAADLLILLEDAAPAVPSLHEQVRGGQARRAAADDDRVWRWLRFRHAGAIRSWETPLETVAEQPEQQERVVPGHIGGRRVNLPELRAHGHGGHEERELRRCPSAARTTTCSRRTRRTRGRRAGSSPAFRRAAS